MCLLCVLLYKAKGTPQQVEWEPLPGTRRTGGKRSQAIWKESTQRGDELTGSRMVVQRRRFCGLKSAITTTRSHVDYKTTSEKRRTKKKKIKQKNKKVTDAQDCIYIHYTRPPQYKVLIFSIFLYL